MKSYIRKPVLAAICVAAALSAARVGRAEDPAGTIVDWAKIVPGDVRFYVELRGLAAVRVQFRRLGIWDTVVELREQDLERGGDRWQRHTEELLGLDPESAISELLGRRSALIAPTPDDWDNGVLLAELGGDDAAGKFLEKWGAKELESEGPVRKYVITGGLMMAVFGRTLAIGPAGDPDGLWQRTAHLMAGERAPNLAGRADFAALRARLGDDPHGVLYAAWNRSDPSAIAGCHRLLAGAWITPTEITCELRGQLALPRADDRPLDMSVIREAPLTTLAAWGGKIDLKARPSEGSTPDQSLAAVFLESLGVAGSSPGPLIDTIGPGFYVLVARDPPALVTGFDLPAVTVICDSTRGQAILDNLDTIIDILGKGLALVTVRPGVEIDDVSVRKHDCEGVELHTIAIGRPLARRLGLAFLERTELCWGLLDGRVILSTSRGHVQEIIRAARGKSPRLGENVEELLPAAEGEEEVECFLIRGSAASAMFTNWLGYVQKNHPDALKPEWWQSWARDRIADRYRLGLGLEADPSTPGRAIVVEVGEFSPAEGLVLRGDVVVSAGGRPLPAEKPAHAVAERYEKRGNARTFDLEVLREGEPKPIRIQIPVQPAVATDVSRLDPIRAIRQLAALTRRAETVSVCRYLGKRTQLDARVVIRWSPDRR
ncbi:MAG: hypothetical protein DCC65_08480 [Planctomycetota bacterium]|nr:MAG: hypothetical protein DCC65_08480 [Planctomycetota bacterium]